MAQGATRKEQRRWQPPWRVMLRRLAAVLFASAALGGVLLGGYQLSQLPIERVAVSGDLLQLNRAELTNRISDALEGGFLWADLSAVRESVEDMPWVYRATVRRHWPNSIEVAVDEQRPIARWGDVGYLNHAGELFHSEPIIDAAEMPLLAGPPGSQRRVMRSYQQVQEALHGMGLDVVALTMGERGGIRVDLGSGTSLVLGRVEFGRRLARFKQIYNRELAEQAGEVRSVDLRYSHGAAVAWARRPGTEDQES